MNSVGAVYSGDTPALGVPQPIQESYSSAGPGEVLYDAQGNALSTPLDPNDPNISAPDGTDFYSTDGIQDFYGTSAAAPAAGAVAALVLSANSALSPAQITSILAQSALPTGNTAGGAGLIQARAAVEIGAADAGDRWNNANDGDWANKSNWSKGSAPNASEGVSIDDNLGSFTGKYQTTVDTLGQVAGSIAVSAPSGSAATLNVAVGGQLTVGGSKIANVTAGDLLTSDNGTLNVTGGALTVSGSINNNDGVVAVSAGSVTANNFTQNYGRFSSEAGAFPSA